MCYISEQKRREDEEVYLDNKYKAISTPHCQTNGEAFNALSYRLQNVKGVKRDMFKKHLDIRPRNILNTPKIDNYGASVNAETKHNKAKGNFLATLFMW